MTRITHRLHHPDRVVAGSVGEPGHRTFHIQVRQSNELFTMLCHKEQLQTLADSLDRLLNDLHRLSEGRLPIPPQVDEADDQRPLELPMETEFELGTVALLWEEIRNLVGLDFFAVTDDEVMAADPQFLLDLSPQAAPDSVEIRMPPAMARQFAARCRQVIAAGRPICPFCAQPMNPGGHLCPRANGYRRPLFL